MTPSGQSNIEPLRRGVDLLCATVGTEDRGTATVYVLRPQGRERLEVSRRARRRVERALRRAFGEAVR